MVVQMLQILLAVVVGGIAGVTANPTPTHTITSVTIPLYSYSSFTYAPMSSARYATPLKSPISFSTPFAPHFSEVSTVLMPNITYTTYSLDLKATTVADSNPYGRSAYAALWANANLSYTDQPPFSTTVQATSIPRSELAFPPALPVVPADNDGTTNMTLPAEFLWGVASSAWQIEGGLQLEGRGPSVEDSIGAIPSNANDSNVNAMFYYMYKQDIERLAEIGIPYLCFSIPWTRVIPFGVAGSPVNTQALDHYDDLINTALAKGITPVITILHYDLPLSVSYSDANFTAHYLYYAKQIMTRYGDRVPYWVTVNEPNLQPVNNALTNILIAHASLYDWYKNELHGTGKITMKFANNLAIPLDTNNAADVAASLRYQDFSLGIMNNPLFLGTQIPSTVLSTTGIQIDRLSEAQIKLIHDKIDFFSFDPYSAQYVSAPPEGIDACAADPNNPLWPTCVVSSNIDAAGWQIGSASAVTYSFIAPQYVRAQMNYVWNTFRPAGVVISEYGFPTFGEYLETLDAQRYDLERSIYYQAFLTEVLRAVNEDGVNVMGALAWSFITTNEFGTFEDQYGLQTLNHTTFERTYKRSAFDYVDFFQRHVRMS
jgi:beta-glucosidase/6-phospho-beta-glucosidase/beta-galactosidase